MVNHLVGGNFTKTKNGGVAVCCQDPSNSTVQFVDHNLKCDGLTKCAWQCQQDPTCLSFNFMLQHYQNASLNPITIECNFFISKCYSVLPIHRCSFFQKQNVQVFTEDDKKVSCSLPYTSIGEIINDCLIGSSCLNGNGAKSVCTENKSISSTLTRINLFVPNIPTPNVTAYTTAGWLVIHQANVSSNESFNKNWNQYKYGFGNIEKGNYWLGNEYVSQLTWMMPNVTWRLHVSVQASANKKFYSTEYWRFRIKSEKELYAIELAGNVPRDAGDAFSFTSSSTWATNLRAFSTPDKDNDEWSGGNCADQNGWWFNWCGVSVLTSTPQSWGTVKSATAAADYNVIYSTMMIMIN
ncbi:hypothetical protein HELRODRAFT_159137 [Helobdella robusta]|uniref:Fibrinogen C-terminal domain-containing protein n=1 Tax=Helobdella robusta TaxID=6412 RepID=T1ENN0_HELRO|nr:hypothetical protein HELRODRAFT_159137 [Helobdella robusta]ESO12577.1 hypothetical protein HELRODRAFT_159137 [Helobdella robusta]